MNGIFELGEFDKKFGWPVDGFSDYMAVEYANSKLSSIGIDAETPGKIRLIEYLEKRNAELNEIFAEICVDRNRFYARVVELERTNTELQKRLHLESRMPDGVAYQLAHARLTELERMIEEAPVIYGDNRLAWDRQQDALDTHRARLVQIEEVK